MLHKSWLGGILPSVIITHHYTRRLSLHYSNSLYSIRANGEALLDSIQSRRRNSITHTSYDRPLLKLGLYEFDPGMLEKVSRVVTAFA